MTTRIELAALEASHHSQTLEIPIATEPQLIFDAGVSHHQDHLHLDHQGIGELMARKGEDPEIYNHTLYNFVTSTRSGKGGEINLEPTIYSGKLYYPQVEIAVPQDITERTVRRLNKGLLHELRHPLQEDRDPLYHRPGVKSKIRLAGMAVVYNSVSLSQTEMTHTESSVAGLMMGLAIGIALQPSLTAWLLDPDEHDANAFAALNRDFKPINYRFEA